MPYVQRDQTNAINGCFANPQPGYAEEWLDDSDPAVVAFLNPPPTPEQLRVAAVKANARRQAIASAYQTSDDAQLIAKVAARYPALTGDALKAVTDLHLMMAGVIRS